MERLGGMLKPRGPQICTSTGLETEPGKTSTHCTLLLCQRTLPPWLVSFSSWRAARQLFRTYRNPVSITHCNFQGMFKELHSIFRTGTPRGSKRQMVKQSHRHDLTWSSSLTIPNATHASAKLISTLQTNNTSHDFVSAISFAWNDLLPQITFPG